uniref:uncharacterized protein LOC122602115 n=1 Tax=Erigeron canadensis TaxID=72917 RepID=UPI001CB95480|nr:uncharacterized protein LOC122602115 [Erigeron canadensis]
MRWSGDVVTDATTITTTTSATTSSASNHLGRVIRPNNIRKRSRISRRTPITLLNTDTTNFRAMVQQYTGGSVSNGGNASSALMARHTTMAPPQPLSSYNNNSSGFSFYGTETRTNTPPASGYNVKFLQQQQEYYTMAPSSSGGSCSDHQLGFIQRVQEAGGMRRSNNNTEQ